MAEEGKPKGRIDYSQVRVIGDSDSEKVAQQIRDLERLIQQTKREYDLWFYGTNPKPPYELRNKLDNHVRLLRHKLPKRTADSFKIGVVLQKYQTLVELWDKSQRKMEEGGAAAWMAAGRASPLDELQEANERRQEESKQKVKSAYVAKITSPDSDVDEMRKVFNSYLAAKKRCGQDAGGTDFEKFRQALGKQTKAIIDSGKGKAVSYRIEIQEGKVAIKARPEQ